MCTLTCSVSPQLPALVCLPLTFALIYPPCDVLTHSECPQALLYSVRFLVPLAASITYKAWSEDPTMTSPRAQLAAEHSVGRSDKSTKIPVARNRGRQAHTGILRTSSRVTMGHAAQFAAEHSVRRSGKSTRMPVARHGGRQAGTVCLAHTDMLLPSSRVMMGHAAHLAAEHSVGRSDKSTRIPVVGHRGRQAGTHRDSHDWLQGHGGACSPVDLDKPRKLTAVGTTNR